MFQMHEALAEMLLHAIRWLFFSAVRARRIIHPFWVPVVCKNAVTTEQTGAKYAR